MWTSVRPTGSPRVLNRKASSTILPSSLPVWHQPAGPPLDEQFHAHQDTSVPKTQRASTLDLLDRLDFRVNRAKSMLGEPLKRVRYLGMLVDTALGVFIVAEDKHAHLLDSVKSALLCRRMKVR